MTLKELKEKAMSVYREYYKEWVRTGMQAVNEYYESIEYSSKEEELNSIIDDMNKAIENMRSMKDA